MQCGASRAMPVFTPPGMAQSDDAKEGTAAHWLASQILTGQCPDPSEWVDRKAPNGVYIDADMVDSVTYYTDQIAQRPTTRFVETPMSITLSPNLTIAARPDVVSDDMRDRNRRVYVDDFKYGWRIVEPEMNWTMIAYALAYSARCSVDPDTWFEFRIHQPRPYHPLGRTRTWIVSAPHFIDLRNQLINQLTNVTDELKTGPHCYKCPSRSFCPALRDAVMQSFDVVETINTDQLDVTELSYMMDALTKFEHLLGDYKGAIAERITHELNNGKIIRNYRIKRNEGSLDWLPGIDASVLRLLAPPGKAVSKEKPITPKQAMKFIPEAIINTISERKPGGSSLVRSDTNQAVMQIFGPQFGEK